ncbi:serine/threonine-protein kinase [Actinomadura sp. B10D3]|uniref:serine/threonine-protein kinase n=1 Tax=Actinomadura sp. B10D3 TaxID=3153557 RepID=UPI00325D3A07
MQPLRADDPVRIAGYRLVGRLGAGSMGRVFLGRAPSGDLVAVKVVHTRFASRQDRRDRFLREISAVRGIDPAYVAPVLDHDADAAEPWLATAYLPGLNLRQAVEAHGPLPAESVRTLGAALADGLVAIHGAGVLHRDLKPSNLVLTPDGPKVVDFGIARPDGADTITMPGSLLGTPGYIPPERIRDRDSTRAGDVFALGALLVYAATGGGPFGAGSAQALLYRTQFEEPRLDKLHAALESDPELVGIIEGCLARDPRRRPTAVELAGRFAGTPGGSGTRWLPDDVAASVTRLGEETPTGPASPDTPHGRRTVLAIGLVATVAVGLGPSARERPRAVARRPADGRTPLWMYRSPDGENRHWFIRPTVAGNVVYLSSTKGVHALSCSRGELLWTANQGRPVYSGVAVMAASEADPRGSGTVLFSDRFLRAVQASDGSPVSGWKEPGLGFTGVPAVIGEQVCLCDSVGYLTAYDGATGLKRWRLRLPLSGRDGGTDLSEADSSGAAASGADWSGAEPGLDPVVAGGRVYVAPGGLFAVDTATRTVKWRFDEADAAPVVHGGLVYSAGAHHVHALDAATGAVRWSRDVGGQVTGGVTVADGLTFAGDASGRLHVLDAATGRPRWRFDTDGPLRAAPSAAAGTVYAAADHDRLYAIGTSDGRLRWSHPLGRQTKVHARLWHDRVLVCVDRTRLCAFPL